MVFSSLEFILIFLPVFYLLYSLVPTGAKNLCLFAASIVFYAVGVMDNPFYLPVFIMSIIVNFLLGIAIETFTYKSRSMLILGLSYNIFLLFIFKYSSFFAKALLGWDIGGPILPIGISFYTFQCMSYIIDVYRGKKAERSFIDLGAYIAMFPQLVAGPIVRYGDISKQIKDRTASKKYIFDGICLFIFGLGFKVLLANRLGGLWNDINAAGFDAVTAPAAWLGIIAFSMQIYFDFWGYSLMAIGLGKTIGFDLPINFDLPYTAISMSEFWRRWHITLGAWFKEYVYIPLGGNRHGNPKTYLNLFVVWFFTGFWHGASFNFVLWGLMLFALIALEKSGLEKLLNKHRTFGRLYMFIAVTVSWLLFATEDLGAFSMYIRSLVGLGGEYAFSGDFSKYIRAYGIYILVGALLSTSIPRLIYNKIKSKSTILIPSLTTILLLSLYCIFKGMNDPFMYFKF